MATANPRRNPVQGINKCKVNKLTNEYLRGILKFGFVAFIWKNNYLSSKLNTSILQVFHPVWGPKLAKRVTGRKFDNFNKISNIDINKNEQICVKLLTSRSASVVYL